MTRAYAPGQRPTQRGRASRSRFWRQLLSWRCAAWARRAPRAGLTIGTGGGLLLLRTVQPAGKRHGCAGFLNGAAGFVGTLPD